MEILIASSIIVAVVNALLILSLFAYQKSREKKNEVLNAAKEIFSETNEKMNTEFRDLRIENLQLSKQMRDENTEAIDKMSKRIEDLSERLNKTLSEVQKSHFEINQRQNEKIEKSLNEIRESNEKRLEEMRKTVDEKLTSTLNERINSSFQAVSKQLESVYKSMGEMKEISTGLTDNVVGLNRVLTNVKSRGTWAEVQLEAILDQTIPGRYDKNVVTKEGSAQRVEFAIKLPAENTKEKFIYLPIDSKFPMEDYIRICNAADKADGKALEIARKQLEITVKNEAKKIREYINEPITTPFAIMYLATEGLYSEVASSRTGLLEILQNEYNVMVAGPMNIMALLSTFQMGFKTIAINDKVNEIRELLSVAKKQYDVFGSALSKIRSKLNEAGSSLDEAEKRNTIIQRKLRKIENIDNSETKKLETEFFELD